MAKILQLNLGYILLSARKCQQVNNIMMGLLGGNYTASDIWVTASSKLEESSLSVKEFLGHS